MLLPGLAPSAPDRPDALVVGERAMSTSELVAAADSLAGRLTGAPAVAVHATPSIETVVATLAGLAAGVPVVPLPADAGPLEAHHILTDSGAVVVLASPDAEVSWDGTHLPGGGEVEIAPVDVLALLRSEGSAPAPRPVDDAAVAMILYTSGTTGLPKGVPIRRRALAAGLDGLAAAWAWGPDDTTVHGLPLWHVHGLVLGVLGPLRLGGKVRHTAKPTPAAYAAAVGAVAGGGGSAVVFGVPTIWSRLAAEPAALAALRPARLLVSGSAALPGPVWEAVGAGAGQAPIERYGMTETLITLSARAEGERRAGWVGVPLDGVETRLVDDAGDPVDHDGESVGTLEVRGPTVMDGYLHRPDATAEVFTADGWLRTGDVACIDRGGWHRVVGRRSTDLIKTGGYRVGAGEVEAALLGHPAVLEAAVIGEPDADLGQAIVAYVVAGDVSPQELIDHVGRGLSAHKRPRRVELVDSLPRNAMGKVQKALINPPA
ncbi:AMP-binding protein [Acidiferrimicrobium sp. IK]|uniref:AMP-binding protein n=1 Tax=Acidiferrimicrobium sp. IK TaxID=2871700 RepID=UPI0021CB0EF7|nr:AMP-binding protein [Acidiferrimicrobium sp. IK]MCU4183212.1 AMP-binding protein [Acidiferrimicrobium sp. IK]